MKAGVDTAHLPSSIDNYILKCDQKDNDVEMETLFDNFIDEFWNRDIQFANPNLTVKSSKEMLSSW